MGRPRSDIHVRVLHAARASFLADGVDGASLRSVAKDAKTSIGMVFYYYPTKDALFLAVVEEVYAKLLADLDAILRGYEGRGSLEDCLRLAFARLGSATREEIDVVRLVVREALVSSPRFHAVLDRFRRGHIGMVLSALSRGVESGEVDDAVPLPLTLIATFAIGAVPQIARRIGGPELPFAALPDPEALAAASVDVLFRGIGPRAPSRKLRKRTAKTMSASQARTTSAPRRATSSR